MCAQELMLEKMKDREDMVTRTFLDYMGQQAKENEENVVTLFKIFVDYLSDFQANKQSTLANMQMIIHFFG